MIIKNGQKFEELEAEKMATNLNFKIGVMLSQNVTH